MGPELQRIQCCVSVNSKLPSGEIASQYSQGCLELERKHCHAMKNKIKNHSVEKVKKL